MTDHVFRKVRKMISDHLRVAEDRITMETAFKEDLRADSLDLVELIMGLEEEFDLEIDESAAESIKTVGDSVRYIEQHTK